MCLAYLLLTGSSHNSSLPILITTMYSLHLSTYVEYFLAANSLKSGGKSSLLVHSILTNILSLFKTDFLVIGSSEDLVKFDNLTSLGVLGVEPKGETSTFASAETVERSCPCKDSSGLAKTSEEV